MKLISWNVNGLRACVDKGFMDFFKEADADVFCIQESKLQADRLTCRLRGITSTGIMRKRKAIPVRRFLQSRSL